jgi:hypothetical protein
LNLTKSYILSDFFQQAVDSIAMFDGSINSDEYLNAWSWGDETETNFKPEEIVNNYNDNIPKNFLNKIKTLHNNGNRNSTPGAIDSWFKN